MPLRSRTGRVLRALALLLPALALAAHAPAQQRPRTVSIPPVQPRHVPSPEPQPGPADTTGLRFRLSEGRAGSGSGAQRPRATAGTPLSEQETARLLSRLPALRADSSAADSFVFPPQSAPPPRTGALVRASFPAPDSAARPAAPAAGALEVVRRGPEGAVDTGAGVTVVFSQPMVPLSSVSEVAARDVPVTLTPQPRGRWRWLDVRTLVFEPEGRMPAATRYTVEVAPRARSALGAVLAAPVRWSFATPAPRATGGYPQGEPAVRDPLVLLTWDQAVDPAAVLPHLRVRAGGTEHRLRLATPAEVAADEQATALLRGHEPGRWTAFRLVSPLPGNAQVRVSVEPGAPSAEGTLRTETVQEWSFRTYGPLRVTGQACGYGSECRPGWPWRIELSNPLDTGAWHDSLVSVEPALPGLEVEVWGNVVMVSGRARPMTAYRVTLHPSVRDRFGQTLGRSEPRVFRVGAPVGRLWSVGEAFLVLDPAGPRRVSVFSNDLERLRVRLLRVRPEDYPAFAAAVGRGRGRGRGDAPALPGQVVVSRVVTPGTEPGVAAEIGVDLTPALTGGLGHVVVAVEPEAPRNEEERGQAVYLWVQSTRIGLTALADDRSLVTWATSLVDGAPLPGAVLTLGAERATTRADGLGTLPLPGSTPSEGGVLVARLGSDVALLPERAGRGGWGGWQRQTVRDGAAWYVATDRNLYRPGEQLRFKGWVRRLVRGDDGGPALLRGADSLRYTVRDGEGNEIGAGVVRLTPLGGFDGAFTLPPGTRLGSASIHFQGPAVEGVGDVEHQAQFEVQEFRRPEFEVTVTADGGPYLVGGSAELTARAGYYSGGGLPGAEVKWSVSATPTRFTPPGWDRWTFGDAGGPRYYGRGPRGASVERSFEGRTDASGTHVLRLDFDRADPPLPSSVAAQATVLDVNRQTWTAGTQLLVHASDLYVGLRLGRSWTEPGKPLEVEVVVVDAAGKPVSGREVEVRGGPSTGEWAGGEWQADSTAQVCRLVSGDAPLRCTFTPERGGRWLVAAAGRDAAGRPSWTQAGLWVSGGVVERPDPPLLGEARQVELIADREEYQPGETAEVLLRAPFFPARGLLTVTRSGIVRTEEFTVGGATHVLRVPVTERDIPDVHLRVELVGVRGGADTTETRGTDFASGALALSVPARSRTLTVTATPRDTVMEPDARTVVELEVRDAAGRPAAGAEVALLVVDEAVLALTGYRHPNPVDAFYPRRGDGTRVNANRPHVLLAPEDFRPAPGTLVGTVTDARSGQPLGGASVSLRGTENRATTDAAGRFRLTGVEPGEHVLAAERDGYAPREQTVRVGAEAHPPVRFALMGTGEEREEAALQAADFAGKAVGVQVTAATAAPSPPPPPVVDIRLRAASSLVPSEPGAPIALRTDFNALAHFAPAVRTDADGRARVEIAIPSNLTRYRVVALAVAGERLFGLGESAVTARRTLMVRPSPPRFLNLGDRFELPVVVQNQGASALEVQVAVRGSGLDLPPTGRSVLVPAGDRVEVRFPAAADRPGTARFQVAVSGGALTDAAEQQFPVWTPATAEAFAVYGVVDSGAVVLPVRVPGGVLPGFGGLEVTTSSTALQELTDAVLYLVRYPYECTEQIASRVVSVAALRDVLTAFRAEGMPSPDSLRASVGRDVAALAQLQNEDGGWGFWRRGDPSWPFVSVHVAHALQRAREKGFTVPDGVMQRALAYLRQVERHTPRTYSARTRNAVAAYALYVRGRANDGGAPAEARRLLVRAGSDSLTLEARGWLLATLAAAPEQRAAADTLARQILNRATETAATATFATSYGEEEYLILHSARRTDAVLLDALIAAQPRSDLIPKVVRGLLGHRRKGRWESTQENAWVLLALDRYFAAYEGATPDFVARAWLGERYVGGHEFRGRTTERAHVAVPMRVLAEGGDTTTLTVAKGGAGRMYYRAGLRYAPASLDLAASVQGFAVERAYEAVDDSADVRRDADGSWRVRAGARVRVRLTMTAPSRRHHVALADPLPAGFEALNPELAGTQTGDRASRDTGERPAWGWSWRWWEHQNLRDERAEAFTSLLPAGTYTYTYLARATTPGSFVVPPARAEEMYHPETFGRTATGRVRVEEEAP